MHKTGDKLDRESWNLANNLKAFERTQAFHYV